MQTNAGTSIEAIRQQHKLPALAVKMVTKDGRICDRAAAGVRKSGDSRSGHDE